MDFKDEKPVVWSAGKIKTPPFSAEARIADAVIISEIFDKKTNQTPKHIIDTCKKRLREYDETS